MRKFRRHGIVISSQLSIDEVLLLQSLIAQLVEMIGADDPDGPADGRVDGSGDDPADTGDGTRGPADRNVGGGPESATGDPDDPFAAWAREFEEPPGSAAPPDDPALRRLFPDAYRDDPEAAAEFRRFTERNLRDKKVSDAQTALQQLALTDRGRHELRIPVADAEPWLRTLTSLRLALAARLGIETAEVVDELADLPDDDPRAYLVSVYDWLGFAQETLIGAL